ncbi:MAG: C25 family cysteine peptidase [Nitrososphaerales archaeon]
MPVRRARRVAPSLCLVLLLAIACTSSAPSPRPPTSSVTAVKMGVDADGVYEVSAADLRKLGFELAGVPRQQVNLSTGGQAVSFEWEGQGKDLAIRFNGLRLGPDSYTPRNIYWLERRAATSPPPAGPQPSPTATEPAFGATSVATATVRLEEDLQYDPQAARLAERWYWQTLFAPAKAELEFDAPGVQAAAGELRVNLIARSSAKVNPDHHLLVFLNGVFVSDAAWDGAVSHLITAAIPADTLKEQDNQLVIQAPGDTGAEADSVQLHWVEVAYRRTASAPEAPRAPASIEAAASSPLPDWPGGADMVVVTAPQFHDALKPLVEARTKAGLRVAVLDVEQVYDAFSYGRTDPHAIQALMRYARQHWKAPAPRFLLLGGDASYDPLGRLKGTEADLVPTQDVYTNFSGWTGSDVWYALPDDAETTLPAFAVGRFPAQTAEQMAAMVQKSLSYEAQTGDLGWRSGALLVADNDEPGFAEETQSFASQLIGYRSAQVTVEGDGGNARTALQAAFHDGTGLIGYFGHGGVALWAKEKIFEVTDATRLTNKDRLPIVFTVTCLSGFFEHPSIVSLGETLLRNANGGAVAALVPSSAGLLPDQELLAQGLAKALSQPTPRALGDIVHDAQLSLPQQAGGVREILLTFNLLGDPSLTIKR